MKISLGYYSCILLLLLTSCTILKQSTGDLVTYTPDSTRTNYVGLLDHISDLESAMNQLEITLLEQRDFNGIVLQKKQFHIQYASDIYAQQQLLGINVSYYQIHGLQDENTQAKINYYLKILPFYMYDYDTFDELLEHYTSLIKIMKTDDSHRIVETLNDNYDEWNRSGIYISDSYISVKYNLFYYAGAARPFQHCYVITIDLNTGDVVKLNDYTNIETINKIIKNGDFELYEADFEYENAFRSADKTSLLNELTDLFNQGLKDDEYTDSASLCKEFYVRKSSNNFYFDDNYIYVYIYNYHASNECLLLKINRNQIGLFGDAPFL